MPANRALTIRIRTALLVLLGAAAGFLILGLAGVATWEYTNSDAFCSNACHQVHPEEPAAHQASQHAEVTCVECHVGRLPLLEAAFKKAGHTAHLWAYIKGYERPTDSPSMPASRKSCEGCHSSRPHQYDSIRIRKHFAADETNTESATGLILRTAGTSATLREGEQGIHWHTNNQIRFIATDAKRQTIPWLEVTRPDGSTRIYQTKEAPLTAAEIESAPKHLMDCVDCHNRVGHPFPNPEAVIDRALAEGDINRELPFVKARAVDLLQQEFTTAEEARQLVEEAWARYQRDFPEAVEDHPEIFAEAKEYLNERQRYALDLLVNSGFRDPDISWRSFPDYSGHTDAPGCFRCHDEKHFSENNTPVRANCSLCHSIPVVMRTGTVPEHFLPTLLEYKPRSHSRPGFIHKHQSGGHSCKECHGEIEYGTDDSSFCANSGCHDREWPHLQ